MKKILTVAVFLMMVISTVITFPDGLSANLLLLVGIGGGLLYINRNIKDNEETVAAIFLSALGLRLIFSTFIHIYQVHAYFGGDAETYDRFGGVLMDSWMGTPFLSKDLLNLALDKSAPGWGMFYLTAALYTIFGRSIFIGQTFCTIIGAATTIVVYQCAQLIFKNKHVAVVSACLVAFFPAFIIWSAQMLKDGPIIFLLVLAIMMVIRLQEKFSILDVAILMLAMFGILSLRFYIFYILVAASIGTFIIGQSNSFRSLLSRGVAVILLSSGLFYFAAATASDKSLDRYANLEAVNNSRKDLAQSASSGFAEDVDVSTYGGALSAIPIGFTYLMFAPFPWQVGSLRQSFTLPEILVWWALMPFLVYGIYIVLRYKLRVSIPIIVFTILLTIAYSVFQGNVGTAYRQRTQIQVFLFMFIAVGYVGWSERREFADAKMQQQRAFLRSRLG